MTTSFMEPSRKHPESPGKLDKAAMHLQRAAQAAYAHEKPYRSPDRKRFVANTTDNSAFPSAGALSWNGSPHVAKATAKHGLASGSKTGASQAAHSQPGRLGNPTERIQRCDARLAISRSRACL